MAEPPPCPYCGAFSFQFKERRWLTCTSCGQEFDIQRDLCPACHRLNKGTATVCAYCDARLGHDTVDRLLADLGKSRHHWQRERTSIAVRQKREEEQASRRRMAAYWAADQVRREEAARAAQEQQRREHKLLLAVGIVTVVLVLAMIVVVLLVR